MVVGDWMQACFFFLDVHGILQGVKMAGLCVIGEGSYVPIACGVLFFVFGFGRTGCWCHGAVVEGDADIVV